MGTKIKRLFPTAGGNSLLTSKSEERIHRFCMIATFLVVALTMIFPLFSSAFALGLGSLDNVPRKMAEFILEPIASNVTKQMEDGATGPVATLFNWMKVGAANEGAYWTNLYGESQVVNAGVFSNAASVIEMMGFAWMVVIAMGHLFTNLEKGMEAQEAVYRILIEICIAGAVILNFGYIISLVIQIGQSLLTSFTITNDTDLSSTVDAYMTEMTGSTGNGFMSIFTWFKSVLVLSVPLIATAVIKLLIYGILIETAIELFIRRFLAPLALADIYQDGLRSPGMRFVKKIFALFIKMTAVMVIATLLSILTISTDQISGNGISYTVELLAVNATAVAAMYKCGPIADEVVGA